MKEIVRKSLGTQGISTEGVNSGYAYIVIPKDVDRESFVSQCLRSKTVMIRSENGTFERDVNVTKESLNNIVFPKDYKDKGSVVIWVMISKHAKPVIVGVLDPKNSLPDSLKENTWGVTRSEDDSSAQIYLDSKGVLNVSVSGALSSMKINILSSQNKGKFNIFVQGEANIYSENSFSVSNKDKQKLSISDKVRAGKEDEDFQPAALGNELVEILKEIISQITQLTVPTSVGPSGTPNNLQSFQNISSQLEKLLSKNSEIN